MCASTVRVNGGEGSGYIDDGEYGRNAKFRGAIGHKNLTNVSDFVVQVCNGVHLAEKRIRCIAQVDIEVIDTYF